MATDRSPYVAIADSLLDEPWPSESKLALVMLSCHMHARWRSDRRLTMEQVAAAHPLSKPDLQKITGKHRSDIALMSLRCLADVASISIELQGDIAWIKWPKWAFYNSTHSRSPGLNRPVRSPSETETETETETEKGQERATSPPPAPPKSTERKPRKANPKTQCPEELSADQWARVFHWRDGNRPHFRDAFMRDQWKAHSEHHRSKENTAADWVLSFYGWLRREWCKPPLAPPREQPPEHVSSDERPPEMTEAEKVAMHEEHLEGKAKRRRRNPPTEEEI